MPREYDSDKVVMDVMEELRALQEGGRPMTGGVSGPGRAPLNVSYQEGVRNRLTDIKAGVRKVFPAPSPEQTRQDAIIGERMNIQRLAERETAASRLAGVFGRKPAEAVAPIPAAVPVPDDTPSTIVPIATPQVSPGVTRPAEPVSGKPSPFDKWTKGGWTKAGKEGITPLGSQPSVYRVTKGVGEGWEKPGSTLIEGMGIPELRKSPEQIEKEKLIISGGARPGGGVGGETLKAEPLKADTSGIDAQIKTIRGNSANYTSSGRLRRGILSQVVELEKAKATVQSAAQGHGVQRRGQDITGKYYDAMSRADERKARIEEGKLAETTRYHNILAESGKDKRESDRTIKEEAQNLRRSQSFDAVLKTFGAYEDVYGNKDTHPAVAIFKLVDSGAIGIIPEEWKPLADKMIADMRAFVKTQKAAKSTLSDSELKLEFYNQLRGIKGVEK